MKIVFTPDWFLGQDVLIEIFSLMILFLFFFFSIKNYKLSKNKKVLYLGIGFLLIAVAELSTIITKLVLYYDTSITQTIGQMIITHKVVKSVDIFYHAGFFFHRLLTLAGFYIIYRLPIEKKSREDFFLALYFIILLAVFSTGRNYLFHITALMLLILITKNYYVVYKKNKSVNTKILILAFGMLALSNTIFILSKLGALYVAANTIELISYIILLILIVKILKHGKKKK